MNRLNRKSFSDTGVGICDRHGDRCDPNEVAEWLNDIADCCPADLALGERLRSASDVMRFLWCHIDKNQLVPTEE